MYILARDKPFFNILAFSGTKAHVLGQVKTQEILRFHDNSDLLFDHTFGKTPKQFLDIRENVEAKIVE